MMMAGATEQAIDKSIRALVERDSELAEIVIEEDDFIDKMELETDGICVDILALKQPAASDLRFVVSAVRTAPFIERIADHAVNIANHAISLNQEPEISLDIDISRMGKLVQGMLMDGLDAFTSGDSVKARNIIATDDEVDKLFDIYSARLIGIMERDPSTLSRGIEWLFVVKHLERIADYVTNICEQVVYMARGQVIKHTIW
jgi:phosphate transport system protein